VGGKDNGKENKVAFPAMTELAQFHEVVGRISDCVGDNHDNVPLAMVCIVLRDGSVEQFTLGADHTVLPMMGAMEVVKIGLMDYLYEDE